MLDLTVLDSVDRGRSARGWFRFTVLLACSLALTAAMPDAAAAATPGADARALFEQVESGGQIDLAALSPGAVAMQRVEVDRQLLASLPAELELPLFDATYTARRSHFERRRPDDLTWRGWIGEGRVILTLKNGYVAGLIYAPEGVVALRALPDGGQALLMIEQDRFPQCSGGVEPPADPAKDALARVFEEERVGSGLVRRRGVEMDAPGCIDVMALYTPQAAAAAGGTAAIEAEIQAAVDEANTAHMDSWAETRFRLVHTAEATYNDSGSISSDLGWVRNNAGVGTLRDQVAADMVSLVVNTGGCGIGYVMRTPGSEFEENAFQVSVRGCLVGNLTYTHEHGHNLGLEHNPENSSAWPNGASYPWSFGFWSSGNFRTVMSYSSPCVGGCTRVPHWSNPWVTQGGLPTGVAGTQENYRSINLTNYWAASFRLGDCDVDWDRFESGDFTEWDEVVP